MSPAAPPPAPATGGAASDANRPAGRAVVIGAGPAGLTVAHELLTRTGVVPTVLEMSGQMGGISRTVEYKGNRIDIGGHRFFSKSDRVMDWWLSFLPLQRLEKPPAGGLEITYQRRTRTLGAAAAAAGPDPDASDEGMLGRPPRARATHPRRPPPPGISLSPLTLRNLGLWRTIKIGVSYTRAWLFPIRPEENLEQFFINRFGRELYGTFFKSYTEKVWGTACEKISAAWGAQRVKGLSVLRAIAHVLGKLVPRSAASAKKTETSLIEQFLYPKLGPGQMWDAVAKSVREEGGTILTGRKVVGIHVEDGRVAGVDAVDASGTRTRHPADLVYSTMPIKDLVRAIDAPVPAAVREIAEGLVYRDFITVGLLCDELKIKEKGEAGAKLVRDNWIYIQEPDVLVGRLQIFNNWSPYMVADRSKVWIGLEYFCNEGDELWTRSDVDMVALAKEELARIDILDPTTVSDAVVIRVEKTYPAYFGTYDRFPELRAWLDSIEGLVLLGRNGMHRYNNQDHSMLTAMVAVDNLVAGRTDRENVWAVNTEDEYHEEGRAAS